MLEAVAGRHRLELEDFLPDLQSAALEPSQDDPPRRATADVT